MGLKEGDNPPLSDPLPEAFEGGADFRGVVAVIII
jgi:hypothetical protein